MKFFIVFSALVAAALATPGAWTLHELSEIIQNPNTDPALLPVFNNALDNLMHSIVSGNTQTTIAVTQGSHELSAWTLNELSEALQDPNTDAALVPYLESALNAMMSDLWFGEQMEYVIVATPIGVLPAEIAPVTPELVVAPTPVSAYSPLVQIIVNVKSQEAAAPVVPELGPIVPAPVVLPAPVLPEFHPVVPSPVVLPAPVLPEVAPVVPSPVVLPAPVLPEVAPVVPSPVVLPAPVLPEVAPVVPSPVVLPAPVLPEVGPVVPSPVVLPAPVLPEVGVNPIDIISVMPEIAVNPIDVIAINPPMVNPVDLMHPVPVVTPVNVAEGILV